MDTQQFRTSHLDAIDRETLSWMLEFCTWKRRKAGNPDDITIAFLLEYMRERLYDYYFIQRNYTRLTPLLESYQKEFGPVQGVTRLVAELKDKLIGS